MDAVKEVSEELATLRVRFNALTNGWETVSDDLATLEGKVVTLDATNKVDGDVSELKTENQSQADRIMKLEQSLSAYTVLGSANELQSKLSELMRYQNLGTVSALTNEHAELLTLRSQASESSGRLATLEGFVASTSDVRSAGTSIAMLDTTLPKKVVTLAIDQAGKRVMTTLDSIIGRKVDPYYLPQFGMTIPPGTGYELYLDANIGFVDGTTAPLSEAIRMQYVTILGCSANTSNSQAHVALVSSGKQHFSVVAYAAMTKVARIVVLPHGYVGQYDLAVGCIVNPVLATKFIDSITVNAYGVRLLSINQTTGSGSADNWVNSESTRVSYSENKTRKRFSTRSAGPVQRDTIIDTFVGKLK